MQSLSTSQNDTAPKPAYAPGGALVRLSTSQNDTAPKRAWQDVRRHVRLSTSQNDTAPKQAAGDYDIKWDSWAKPKYQRPPEVVKRAGEIGLSGYALTNVQEMVAESFAQLLNGNVTTAAKDVFKILLEHSSRIDFAENALLKKRLEGLCY